MDQTSALTSQLIRIESRFCWSMWVGVCLRACACDFLRVYVGVLLFLHCVHLLHLHAILSVFKGAFLTSSNNDPYGSHHCDANLIHLEPAVCEWLSWLKKVTSYLETCIVLVPKLHLPNSSSQDTSLIWMTFNIFSAIYFQAVMWCSACGWGASPGAPVSAHVHVIRPYMEWHLAWPCGALSGSRELIYSQSGMPDIWSQTC